MNLKPKIGKLEVKGLGVTLTPHSTDAQIASALAHKPSLAKFIDGIPSPPKPAPIKAAATPEKAK